MLAARLKRLVPPYVKMPMKRTFRRITGRGRPDRPLRLHLGCGLDYRPGYVNIDRRADADCDLQADIADIARLFAPGTVAEVLIVHALPYLRLWQARELIADVHRLLASDGLFVIETTDVLKCARLALDGEGDLPRYLEALRGIYGFSHEQIERREPSATAAFGWSGWHLKHELEQVGFRKVTICEPQTHRRRVWRDTRVEAIK